MKYLAILLLQGCTIQAGIGYQFSIEEEVMENPIAVFRLERQYTENIKGTCEHLSSIPMYDDIIVFNFCDLSYEF